MDEYKDILKLNEERNKEPLFNPYTGEGSPLAREPLVISDFPIPVQYVPKEMFKVPLIKKIKSAGTIHQFILSLKEPVNRETRESVINRIIRVRCLYDFPFWAATFVKIKKKGGGDDILFRLNKPQRHLITLLEDKRIHNKPIRLILLKARQWGGSTCIQIYMSWLQLIHKKGLNSIIVGHVSDSSAEVKDMFDRMLTNYPIDMLHEPGEEFSLNEPKTESVAGKQNIQRIPQRNCKIKIGTAESPESARGGDYNLVHCTEVGMWKKTDGKTPQQIIRSACSGILLKPYTMIVYESTANGMNFFQEEYDAAKRHESQFDSLFIPWYEIEQYALPIENKEYFAQRLYNERENLYSPGKRVETGKYLWWLWEQGASLEAINWYVQERSKYNDHGDMASEYPSDDVEAFVNSGFKVFDKYQVEALKSSCKAPRVVGDVYADEDTGTGALSNLRFKEDHQGLLQIWDYPEPDIDEKILDRYLTVVDIGGRSRKADWSVILVIDRMLMADGGRPVVVAQWYGHIDMDILAWKALQIAAYYNNSLLVIESNTLETHDRDREVDGDQSSYILNQIKEVYPNLYARAQSEQDIIDREPVKYGFHTNVSTKPMIISTLVKVIREKLYIERDIRCVEEYLDYEKKPNGSFGAVAGKHDDLLMTRAIGLHICFNEMDIPRIVQPVKRNEAKIISAATL